MYHKQGACILALRSEIEKVYTQEFDRKKNHINDIWNFLGWSKIRLAKLRGLNRKSFYLHLKEGGSRFNHRELNSKELYAKLLMIVR